MLGMMTWHIEVGSLKAEQRRDTTGPTVAAVQSMLDATSGDTEAETRDYAIVLTFFALGLRVSELCGLNLEETDLVHSNAWILGKGRREKELVPCRRPSSPRFNATCGIEAHRRGSSFNRSPSVGRRGMAGSARGPS
jgi:site-specific recombinase XerC